MTNNIRVKKTRPEKREGGASSAGVGTSSEPPTSNPYAVNPNPANPYEVKPNPANPYEVEKKDAKKAGEVIVKFR